MIMASLIPDHVSQAISVIFFPRLPGTEPYTRFPLGARAYSGVRPMWEATLIDDHQCTSIQVHALLTPFGSCVFVAFCCTECLFLARPAHPSNDATHRTDADLHTTGLLPDCAVHLQRRRRMGCALFYSCN